MFYDLNIPWTSKDDPELPRTAAFLAELGYNVIALTQTIAGKITSKSPGVANVIPENPFPDLPSLRVLRRATVILDDPSQNYGLASLSNSFDIIALRPTDEKLLLQACTSLECDLISLDMSVRHPFHFKYKVLGQAISRGIRFEITYAASIHDANARRNLLSNAAALVRATKGKGVTVSSEARNAAFCRAPFDVINLATLWGLNQENGNAAITTGPRSVMLQAKMKRQSFRGVIDVIDGGGVPKSATAAAASKDGTKATTTISQKARGKRKADTGDTTAATDAEESTKESTPVETPAAIGDASHGDVAESRPAKKQKQKQKAQLPPPAAKKPAAKG